MSFTPYPKQSTIWLLSGVPLDPSYEHTVKFLTKAAQLQAFTGITPKVMFTSQSYQRAGEGKLRIAALADDLYRYNYLMFQNRGSGVSPQYGDKWFYCFIEDVTYINDHTTEISYSIDVMQTYMFDYELGMCYVEREHSETDGYGQHITEEGLDIPDAVIQGTNDITNNLYSATGEWRIYFYYVPNTKIIGTAAQDSAPPYALLPNEPTETPASPTDYGVFMDGSIAGVAWTYLTAVFNSANARETAATNVSKMVAKLLEISASIVGIEIVPSVITSQAITVEATAFKDSQGSDYTPNNKKLYSYPFRYILVSNNQGDSAKYKWEDFKRSGWTNRSPMECAFQVSSARLPHFTELLQPVPEDYLKSSLDNSIVVQNTNLVAWSEDSFAKWWATSGDSFIMGIMGQTINNGLAAFSMGMGAVGGSAVNTGSGRVYLRGQSMQPGAASGVREMGLLTGVVTDIISDIATISSHKNEPDRLVGGLSQSSILNRIGKFGFTIYDVGIRARDAKIIDDFFTKYGYAVKRVKLPNIEATSVALRPHWNYLKTKGCTISGEYLPAFASRQIEQIYDKGITFWRNMSEVGDYSLNNNPT